MNETVNCNTKSCFAIEKFIMFRYYIFQMEPGIYIWIFSSFNNYYYLSDGVYQKITHTLRILNASSVYLKV